ncbi:hypothetical protein O181_053897 [Austropuccinia psidii MF-1]|uniref:Integrase zinc-binding domain-containing protein n=1 Tax=Austropuccinia psidii MF-1 TaxID=1389203 RepID=A0A9Q3HRZ1_9BASI|nr:hypothetical protein [Austropuccinia psidii MF-1]
MTIIYKQGKSHTNSDGCRRWLLDNVKSNPAYDPKVAANIAIHLMEIDRRKNSRVFKWEPESGDTDSECGILLQLLQQKYRSPELESQLEKHWSRDYKDNKYFLIDGLIYHKEKHTSALTVVDRDHISLILKECHDYSYMGHMSEDRTKERVASTPWWPKWEQELSEYINTCKRCQMENRKHGILQHIE